MVFDLGEEFFFLAIVERDPAAPVDFVEEPVHHDEEDDDGEEAAGGLQIEGGDVVADIVEDADGDEPGDEGGEERGGGAGGDGGAVGVLAAGHAGGDGGENEDALEAFAEDEDGDVHDGAEVGGVVAGGVRRAGGGDALPYEDAGDGGGGAEEEELDGQFERLRVEGRDSVGPDGWGRGGGEFGEAHVLAHGFNENESQLQNGQLIFVGESWPPQAKSWLTRFLAGNGGIRDLVRESSKLGGNRCPSVGL